jgi:hypothetical protein
MTTDTTTRSPTQPGCRRANGSISDPKPAPTKAATIIKLLTRTRGATMTELSTATGWQLHSLRAFMSGLRKAGATIARAPRKSGEPAYRLVRGPGVTAPVPVAGAADAIVADSGAATGEVA